MMDMNPTYIILAGFLIGVIVYIITKAPVAIGLGLMWGGIGAYIVNAMKAKN